MKMIINPTERKLLLLCREFEENEHPRREDGEFTKKGGTQESFHVSKFDEIQKKTCYRAW